MTADSGVVDKVDKSFATATEYSAVAQWIACTGPESSSKHNRR